MLVGVVIGTEREYTHRPAGMRTHMLVALGACAVMITSQLIFYQYRPYGATPDPARLSAQVITGVGFLGAGTILREGTSIKGLTTAASIWAVACLGVAVGAGFFTVGLLGAVCMLITLIVFEWLQNKLMHGRDETYSFCVTCGNVAAAMEQINAPRRAGGCDGVVSARGCAGGGRGCLLPRQLRRTAFHQPDAAVSGRAGRLRRDDRHQVRTLQNVNGWEEFG